MYTSLSAILDLQVDVILFHVQLVEELLSDLVCRYHHSAGGHHFQESRREAGVEAGNSAGSQDVLHGANAPGHWFLAAVAISIGAVDELLAEFDLKGKQSLSESC